MSPILIAVVFILATLVCVALFLVYKALRLKGPAAPDPGLSALQAQVTALNQQLLTMSQNTGEQLGALSRATGEQVSRLVETTNTALSRVTGQVQDSVSQSQGQVNQRLNEAGRALTDIQKQMAALERETQHLKELGKDIHGLQDLLRSPKLRGGLGEVMLERILQDALPPGNYEIQHRFGDRCVVDAVVCFSEGMVPIDSKFPLENYRAAQKENAQAQEKAQAMAQFLRDVKARVDEIAQYIRPDEGTFDFALMYVPSESVYYEVVVQDEKLGEKGSLLDYAARKRVFPVSPNSLLAYLQVIALGLKGMRVEKEARRILDGLAKVQADFCKFRDDFERVGKKIEDAANAYGTADKRFGLLDRKMEKVTGHTAEELAALEAVGPGPGLSTLPESQSEAEKAGS